MKSLVKLFAAFLVITGCNTQSESMEIKSFIKGTYVRSFEDDFSKGNDTIEIQPTSTTANDCYKLVRKMGYQQTIDGRQLSPQHKVENGSGCFDTEKNVLEWRESGRMISFNPAKNEINLGASIYSKVK